MTSPNSTEPNRPLDTEKSPLNRPLDTEKSLVENSSTELLGMENVDVSDNIPKFTAHQISEPVDVKGYIFPSQSMKVISSNGKIFYMTLSDYQAEYGIVPSTDGRIVVRLTDLAAAVKQQQAYAMETGTAPGVDNRPPRKVSGEPVISENYDKNSDTLPASYNRAAPVAYPTPPAHPTRAAALAASHTTDRTNNTAK